MKKIYTKFFYGVVDNINHSDVNYVDDNRAKAVYLNIKHPVCGDLNDYFSGPVINFVIKHIQRDER